MASQTCIRYEQRAEYPDKYNYWLLAITRIKDLGYIQITYRREEWINRDWVTLRFRKCHSDTTQTCIFYNDEWRDINNLEKIPWRDVEVLNEWAAQFRLAKRLHRDL